jgi:hypothetical protein
MHQPNRQHTTSSHFSQARSTCQPWKNVLQVGRECGGAGRTPPLPDYRQASPAWNGDAQSHAEGTQAEEHVQALQSWGLLWLSRSVCQIDRPSPGVHTTRSPCTGKHLPDFLRSIWRHGETAPIGKVQGKIIVFMSLRGRRRLIKGRQYKTESSWMLRGQILCNTLLAISPTALPAALTAHR